jgi:hypothetical protein
MNAKPEQPRRSRSGTVGMMLAVVLLGTFLAVARGDRTLREKFNSLRLNPFVPLTHCMMLGEEQDFKLEWALNMPPKSTLELRFSSSVLKGFSSVGFAHGDYIQLVTGFPQESLPCARTLFDNFTPYDLNGNPYPNFPEVPGQIVVADNYTSVHYLMRNLSIAMSRNVQQGLTVNVNVSLLWSYWKESLYSGACYGANVADFTEIATYSVPLTDGRYSSVNGQQCLPYSGQVKPYRRFHRLNSARPMLNAEIQQNQRATALLMGGDLLLQTAKQAPRFAGRVMGGENANGVCSNSLTTVYAQWFGFSSAVGGITDYLVSIGTTAKPSLYYSGVNVSTNQAFSGPAPLRANVSYIVTVQAFDFSGLTRTVISRPVFVLNGGSPIFARMYGGSLERVNKRFQRSATTLNFSWSGWITEEHSSKDYATQSYSENGFQYALGTANGAMDSVVGWTAVPYWRSEVSLTGLTLANAASYVLTIRAQNCATRYTQQTSPPVTIDYSNPLPGTVVLGNNTKGRQRFATMTFRTLIRGSWFGFIDLVSGIVEYRWTLSLFRRPQSPSTDTNMLVPWQGVGMNESFVYTPLVEIPHSSQNVPLGSTLFLHVMAVDAVGNFVIATSNGTRVTGF